MRFTFQYGQIKTAVGRDGEAELLDLHSNMDRLKPGHGCYRRRGTTDLHSNMDRLKRVNLYNCEATLIHLHSNMDRLKPASCRRQRRLNAFTFQYGQIKTCNRLGAASLPHKFTFQYGQIKTLAMYRQFDGYTNLHSNMDRLKRITGGRMREVYTIYIPIWID